VDTLLLKQHSNKPRPASLVACAQAGAVITMKKFVEQEIVAPVSISLQAFIAAVERTAASLTAQKETGESL